MENKENHYKNLLETELQTLEAELKTVGQINPSNPNDWEGKPSNLDIQKSDENEVADSIESYEGNTAILKQLEIRYNEVKAALERIEKKTFGICVVGGETIETERLIANPAATTCTKHLT